MTQSSLPESEKFIPKFVFSLSVIRIWSVAYGQRLLIYEMTAKTHLLQSLAAHDQAMGKRIREILQHDFASWKAKIKDGLSDEG